jgi:hypothetical protein
MSLSNNSGFIVVDDDDDLEMQEMFGFRSKSNHINKSSSPTSNENSCIRDSCKERDDYNASLKRMDENIHLDDLKTADFMHSGADEDYVKFVRLGDTTADIDIEEMEAQFFQKYTENENEPDPENLVATGEGDADDDDDDDNDNDYFSYSDEGEEGDEEFPASCQPCSSSSTSSQQQPLRYQKSSDSDLKCFAYGIPRSKVSSCNKRQCQFGGNCVDDTSLGDMKGMMEAFWCVEDKKAPFAATRRLLLLKILSAAINRNDKEFYFYAGCKSVNNRRVCEAAFLNLLGLMNSPNASDAPNQWRRLKEYVSSGKDILGIEYSTVPVQNTIKGENRLKFNGAVAFIEYFAKNFGDTIPDEHGKFKDIFSILFIHKLNIYSYNLTGGPNVYVAPFVDFKSFFNEYKYYAAHHFHRPETVASFATFKRAFANCATCGIKKLKAKGTFNTCEICNNASLLLSNKGINEFKIYIEVYNSNGLFIICYNRQKTEALSAGSNSKIPTTTSITAITRTPVFRWAQTSSSRGR